MTTEDPPSTDDHEAPHWSLITVSYNSRETLASHWADPRPPGVEWIVVDNASSDGSGDEASSLGADKVIRLSKNLGFGGANNVGFQESTGRYVAFVNPDVIVDYDSLEHLEEALSSGAQIVGPQLLYPNGQPQPSGRGLPSLVNKVLSRLNIGDVRARYYIEAEPGERKEVAWLIGAAVAAQRETLHQLGDEGPWDTAFFVYYEDADLGLRSWASSLSVQLVGSARWTHSWARETSKLRLKPWLLEIKAMTTFYRRYPMMILGVALWGKSERHRARWGADHRGAA